jgi:hypothetical protein
MNMQTIVRGRLLPASIILAAVSLGCIGGLPSRFAIHNQSSQTLVVKGQHHEGGATINLTLPPGGTADLILRESGDFAGNIQANQQRWSTRSGDRLTSSHRGLAFVDDPTNPGMLTLLPFDPGDGFEFRLLPPPPPAGQYLVVNNSFDPILVSDSADPQAPAKLLQPNQSLCADLPPSGPVALTIIRKGQSESVIIPRDSDRTWEVR